MSLEKEMETYNKLLPQLLADEGKYALIFKNDLVGTYGTYEDALKIGYEKAELEPFLVKKISSIENVSHFSRDIDIACPTVPSL